MQQVACRRGFLAQLQYLHELTHYLENLMLLCFLTKKGRQIRMMFSWLKAIFEGRSIKAVTQVFR